MEKKISKGLFKDEFDWNISNNSMVVIETVGIPNQGMSYSALQGRVGYRQTKLEEFDIDE